MKAIHMKKVLFLFFIFTSINLIGQEKLKGDKIVVTEDRNISEFTKIEIRDDIDVILKQGTDQSVTVETDENLQSAVLTDVSNNTLIIDLSNKIIRKKTLLVYVTVNQNIDEIITKDKAKLITSGSLTFNAITINAEGDSKIIMDLKTTDFNLNNNESGSLTFNVNSENAFLKANKTGKSKINLTTNKLEVLSQGNSSTELTGYCKEVLFTSENKSKIRAEKLECEEILINASDSSDSHVNAKNSISISAINLAEIYIYNNPTIRIRKFADKAVLRKK